MYLGLLIGSLLFSPSLAVLVTPTASTSDATITPGPQIELLRKQNGDNYMGWLSYSKGWSAESCDAGNTFYQTGQYWACCSTVNAGCRNMPYQCISGSLIYSLSASTASGGSFASARITTVPCTSAYPDPTDRSFTICNTAYLYQNELDTQPRTNVNCGVSSKNWSYYRVAPESATARTSTSSSSRSSSSSSRSTSSSTSTSSTTSPIVSPTSLPTSTGQKSKSKAWIAGAVAGPIIGLALIASLLWFCLVKRKKKNNNKNPSSQPPHAATATNIHTNPPTSPTTTATTANYHQPPNYYTPPPMQQTHPHPETAPYGVAKHDSWTAQSAYPPPQSPHSSSQSAYPPQHSPQHSPPQQWPQQWPHQGTSPHMNNNNPIIYAPSPSTSPQPHYAQPPPLSSSSSSAAVYADQGGVDQGGGVVAGKGGQQVYSHDAGVFSSELEGSGVVRR